MSDKLAFLDEPKGSNGDPAPTPEPAKVETPPPPLETQPVNIEQPPIEQPKPKEPGEWTAVMAFDERDKRIAIQKERDELAAWKAEQLQKAQSQPQIDPITDPEGFRLDFEQKVEKAKQDILFDTTHRFAVKAHGPEVVKAAEEWLGNECKSNPAFFQTVMRQPDPYEFVVKQFKRSQAFAKIGDDDPDAWFEKQFAARIQEKGYVIPERGPDGKFVAASPAPATQTPLPKPSLASAPAASGNAPKTPVGEGVAFGTTFKD